VWQSCATRCTADSRLGNETGDGRQSRKLLSSATCSLEKLGSKGVVVLSGKLDTIGFPPFDTKTSLVSCDRGSCQLEGLVLRAQAEPNLAPGAEPSRIDIDEAFVRCRG
jgi:hypothetical protein